MPIASKTLEQKRQELEQLRKEIEELEEQKIIDVEPIEEASDQQSIEMKFVIETGLSVDNMPYMGIKGSMNLIELLGCAKFIELKAMEMYNQYMIALQQSQTNKEESDKE
jgi:hypothetical protein